MTKHKFQSSIIIIFLLCLGWWWKGDCQTRAENNTSAKLNASASTFERNDISLKDHNSGITITGPEQSLKGPGGADYAHDSVAVFDYADTQDGYWLYLPQEPVPKTAPVVVLLHGYGAYNPMIYGRWIRHLVRKGNAVVFPRYQKNLFSPSADEFIPNTVTAIKQVLTVLDSVHQIEPQTDRFAMAGHSYGGVIAAGIAADHRRYGVPQPKALLLCSPGSGPFKGGVLKNYEGIPADTRMVVMVSENDRIVGDKLGKVIYNTATNTKHRNFVRQFPDTHSQENPIHAGHNECYSIDYAFDNEVRNITTKRAMHVSECNALDYNGYWKLLDALMTCDFSDKDCSHALGDTKEQRSLGRWSDGKPIRELEVLVPGGID